MDVDKQAVIAPPNDHAAGTKQPLTHKNGKDTSTTTTIITGNGEKAQQNNNNTDAAMDVKNDGVIASPQAPNAGATLNDENKADGMTDGVDGKNNAAVGATAKESAQIGCATANTTTTTTTNSAVVAPKDAAVATTPTLNIVDATSVIKADAVVVSDTPTAACYYTGPAVNTEIEVLWQITGDDGSEEVTWWKAIIQGSEFDNKTGQRTAILLYDAHGGFEEEVVRVRFKSESELVDLGRVHDSDGGILQWRLYDANNSNSNNNEVITCGELVEDSMEDESRVVYEAGLQALGKMPAQQQSKIAAGYRNLADHLKNSLKALADSNGKDYIVTAEDMQKMLAALPKAHDE